MRISYWSSDVCSSDLGVDDLLTRGHGVVKLPANFNAAFEYDRPRKGNWAYDFEVDAVSGGLAGNDKIGYAIEFEPTYFVSDALSLNAGFYADRSPDWLVWQHYNLIGSFEGREWRSEEHTSELQSLMRISYAVFC